MALWYKLIDTGHHESMDLVSEFLDIWLQTRKNEAIDPDELAGVIDVIYECQPSPGDWVLIEVRPSEIASYISSYVNSKGEEKAMMAMKDYKLRDKYVNLLNRGYKPTPIIITGATEDTGEQGIGLIDGRHRIHSYVAAGIESIEAYIPRLDLPKLQHAVLKATPTI
jgi:hypothetical protein